MSHYFYLFIVILSVFGCAVSNDETNEERIVRIEKAVAEKIEERKKSHLQKCKNDAIVIAERMVDSILLAEAKRTRVDTVIKPDVPPRPETPIVIPPKDSTEIKPLFEEIPDSKNLEHKIDTTIVDTTLTNQ
ncbi:MAG: hypothetical protein AAF573_08265 [Bacteroidota bacterium]